MKRVWNVKALIAGTALAAAMWTGMAQAEEQFQIMEGIPAEAVSQNEMAEVEGKIIITLGNTLGPNTVIKILEPGILLQITALGLNVGGPGAGGIGGTGNILNLNQLLTGLNLGGGNLLGLNLGGLGL